MFSILVTMPSGISLSVNVYPPSNFDIDTKYISLVEMTPYRKDDWLTNMGKIYQPFPNDNIMYILGDIRGTGNSEGDAPKGEYFSQELDDYWYLLTWISNQSWSNSDIYVIGFSWSGVNALHMAAYPYLDNNIIKYGHPNLRGVISMMASPNLYEDDIYFINSCLHM